MSEIKRSLAIVIGINEYTHIPKLKNAVSDAVGLANVLKDIYSYEVLLLLNQRATKAELDKLVANLQNKIIQFDNKKIKVDQSDRLLFYFAGHGFAEEAQDSESGKPAGYFMPQNAQEKDKNTWLSMQEVYEAFSNLGCHHLLMILDCCFAGRISWVGQGRNAARSGKLYRQNYEHFIKHKTEQIITSAAYDEEAQDLSRFGQRGEKNGNSPFAHLLLKVLQGNCDRGRDKFIEAIVEDGVITTQELFAYLQNRLGQVAAGQTPRLSQPRKYDPETKEYVYLKGEYIFPLPKFNPEHLPKFQLNKNTNPYKGLASFDTQDSHLFFGRTILSQQLADVVKEQPLTIVLGVSGSGKSSLAKAGLIPILEQESSQQQWQILAPMRPGGSPFKELNKILAQSKSGSSIINLPLPEKIRILYGRFEYWAESNSQSKLLLVIDQSEELLTLSKNCQEQKDFLILLAELQNKYPQLHIVFTLRSDFESQIKDLVDEPNWQKAWQQGRFIVTPMNREELQQVIEEPAARRTLFFESPKLVNQLIDEAVDRIGILPLLSFTLSELYLKYLQAEENGERSDRTIAEADYLDLGGVEGSLAQAAKRTYRELIAKKIKSSTISNIMLRMISLNGSEITRRRVFKSELNYPEPINKDVELIINRFVEARLFAVGIDTEGQEYVESVHDALVTRWQKLISKPETQENLLLQRRLTPAAEEWDRRLNKQQKSCDRNHAVRVVVNWFMQFFKRSLKQSERSEEKPQQFLWNASPYLDILNQEILNSTQNNWLNKVETEFVRKSIKQRRRNTQARWIAISTTIALLSIATILALLNSRTARIQEISTLIEVSKANLQANNQLDAIVEAIRAKHKLDKFWLKNDNLSLRVQGILGQTVHHNQQGWKERLRLQATDVIFSPDGKLIATRDNNIVRVRDSTGKLLQTIKENRHLSLENFVFSPDGKKIATASSHKVPVWDTATGEDLQTLNASENATVKALSPDGKKIAIVSGDIISGYTVRVWDTSTGKELQTFLRHEAWVRSLVFSPNGKRIATASDDNTVRVWDTSTGKKLQTLRGHQDSVRSVVFSPDGKRIVTVTRNHITRIWRVGNIEDLLTISCDWVRYYLASNPSLEESDRTLCDSVPPKSDRPRVLYEG